MKLIRQYLENIEGIGIFPSIAFVIFFLTFIGVLVFVFRMKKDHTNQMKQLPLDDDNDYEQSKNLK